MKPICPVAQKTQPMAQPTCELTQAVTRPVKRILHGLDAPAVGEPQQELAREAVGGVGGQHRRQHADGGFGAQAGPELGRQLGHLVDDDTCWT